MRDLPTLAAQAVAKARETHPNAVRIAGVRYLRDETGMSIVECLPYVDAAMQPPTPTLTRAAKATAVAELARRLAVAAQDYERRHDQLDAEDAARGLRRRHAALVRVAMARTVD